MNINDEAVLLVDEDGNSVGKMLYDQALRTAQDKSLDLVLVSENDTFNVYRLADKGKWQYDKRKSQKNKHKNKVVNKSMKFSLSIEKNDQDTKISKIRKFLDKKYNVNIIVFLKGREKAVPDHGRDKIEEILSYFRGSATVEDISKGTSKNQVIFSAMVRPLK